MSAYEFSKQMVQGENLNFFDIDGQSRDLILINDHDCPTSY
jgi:hypothetical protein